MRVLIKVMKQYAEIGKLTCKEQKCDGAETYFIIHPVLKHIALLGIAQMQEQK